MEDLKEVIQAYFIDLNINITDNEIEGLLDHLDATGYSIVDIAIKNQ